MPYSFDVRDFASVVDDARRLRAVAVNHRRRLEPWADAGAATRSLTDDEARRLSEILPALYEESEEQHRLADAIVGRLVGSGATDSTERRPLVLIVDDSQASLEATALLLEQSGFHVVTATNGLEALIVAHYARPVVVLLDLMMPILDGLQTARLLSESPSTSRVKVIAYSGRTDMFSKRLPGTFAAILAKPTTPQELLTLVQQHVATVDPQ
jgi:CheY-like chemotaxis protein